MSGVLGDTLTMALVGAGALVALFYLFVLLVKLENGHGHELVSLISPLILAGISVSILFSERDPSSHSKALESLETTKLSQLCLQASTGLILLICLVLIGNFMIRRSRLPSSSRPLFLCFILFFVTNYVLNSLFGLFPHFDHYLFYTFLVFVVSYLHCESPPESVLLYTREIVSCFLVLSCLLALVAPDLVIESNYHSSFTLFDFRFWGLTSHANNTGPLLVIYILILLCCPYRSRLLQYGALLGGAAVIVATQSKTAWVAGVAAVLYLVLYRRGIRFRSSQRPSRLRGSLMLLTALVVLFSLAALGLLWFINSPYLSLVSSGAISLTGRDDIWQISLNEGLKNPIFGYGPLLWGESFSSNYGLLGIASNAHNQFVQALASAGAVGLAGTVVFVWCICYYAWKTNQCTGGFSGAMLVAILIRSITEVPLNGKFLLSTDFMVTLFLVNVLLRYNHLRSDMAQRSGVAQCPARTPKVPQTC